MARSAVGSCLACASLFVLGCGESSSSSNDDSTANQGGSSGASTTGGSSGASATGGSGTSATGGSAGTSTGIEPYFQPGARLKPLVIAAAPGLDIMEGNRDGRWYDSELEFDCYFRTDEAGVERCFPASTLGEFTYADASCTRPVLTISGSSPCDRVRYEYLVVDDRAAETCGVRGFHVGGALPATTPLFSTASGTCQSETPSTAPSQVYELEAAPPETFVRMQNGRRPRAPGLDAYVREGDDGSWQVIAYFDPVRESACFDIGLDTDPPSKCIPPWASWAGYFVDAACEVPISQIRPDACPLETPEVILDYHLDPNTCLPVRVLDLHEIEASRETVPYDFDASGACIAANPEPSEAWIAGTRIDLSTIPSLEMLLVGTGPVQGHFSGFGGIPFLPEWRKSPLLDAEFGVRCDALTISDGTLRCVRRSFLRVGPPDFFHESASCDGARVVLWQPDPPCLTDAPLPEGVVLFGDPTECSSEPVVTEAIAFAGPSTASALYFTNSMTGACEPVQNLAPGLTPFVLGESLDPAETFLPIERTMRQ